MRRAVLSRSGRSWVSIASGVWRLAGAATVIAAVTRPDELRGGGALAPPGPKRELAAVAADITELDQGQQEAAGSGPGQSCCPGHLAQAQPLPVGPERPDHREAAVQRLDEVAVSRLRSCGGTSLLGDRCRRTSWGRSGFRG